MTTRMVRKQFYIPKQHDDKLKRLSRIRGLSEAEIIRQMIDREESDSPGRLDAPGLTAIDGFTRLALSKRLQRVERKPYRWNRQEIYAERESRWLRDRKED